MHQILYLQGTQLSLSCPQTDEVIVNGTVTTRVTCSIGNPLAGPNENLQVTTVVIPQQLVGNEMPLNINFSVSSVNPENEATIADGSNSFTGQLLVTSQADVILDSPG